MALNPQEKIKEFDEFRVEDAQPTIEALSDYVCYETGSFSNPLNFADRDGFPTRFSKEAEHIAKMNEILEAGEYFVHSVYTYRSIHRALPNVKPNEEKKAEMYRRMFEVLQPEIKKIRDLLMFFNEAVELLAHIVLDLVSQEKKKEIPSDTVLDFVARVLDMFLKLDSLKNMKAALSNDFASYKRAIPFMDLAGLDTQAASIDVKSDDNIKLYDFLSKSGFILKGLKDCLAKVASFEDIIILVINRCSDNFEAGRYIFCDEKHANLRVCALGLYLIDNNSKTNHLKKLDSLTNLYKLFKRYPCIPLYGDMTFTLKSVLKQCPNLNEAEWSLQLRDEQKLEQQILIVNQVPAIRSAFVNFVTTFSFCTNKIRTLLKNNKEVPDTLREEVKTLSEQGIQMISDWTCKILEQSAWKYAHPAALSKLESEVNGTDEKQEEQKPGTPSTPASTTTENGTNGEASTEKKQEVSDYERVVRFNYSAEERSALVDVISMIKGVEGIMSKNTGLIAPLLKGQIFFELQTFCKSTLYDMLVRTKTKKRPVHTVVLELRNIAENWLDKPPVEIKKRSKKDPIPEFPKRKVGPSFTQLHMVRSILSVLYSDRSPGMQKKGLLGEKDFSESQVKAMRAFYNQSFYWTYLLNYNATLKKASDLASLWYREFYLEISKRIQFPIEMSLPWILAEDIIEKRNTTLMESIIYPLALYNDAAHRALFVLKRKFLYDEIEAEVNLVFDQMVYKLSEQMYQYFKIVSSNILLDNKFRSGIEKIQRITRWHVPKSRYDVLLSQKHINLLGRLVDLNFLITQRINKNIKENILKAIQRFESQPLNNIIEFESMLDTIRLTHKLLSFHLNLDPFETLLAEVNESLSAVSFEGRIARHVCEELIYDLFPSNVFNSVTQRFIAGPVVYSDGDTDYQREKAPRIPPQYLYGTKGFINSYAHVHDQYQSYFGEEHVRSLIRIVGIDSLAVIVESCVTYMEEKIYSEMSPYVEALMEAIPPQVKLQPAAYGLYGVFSYFKVTFRDFLDYEMLKPGVFQSFKVIGNCLSFLMMLDTLVGQKSISQYIAAAPFLGIKPLAKKDKDNRNTQSGTVGEGDETIPDIFVRADQLESTPLLTRINLLVSNPELQGILRAKTQAADLPKTAMRAAKLYNPPRGPTSLFKQVLERCTTILNNVREQWKGTSPPDRLQKLDSSKEFYRLWGILQYIFCMKQQAKNSDFEIFGDGFFWGGCSIVYLFGQQLRFDAFNFTDHVLNVHTLTINQQQPAQKAKGKEAPQVDPEIQEFLVNANEIRILNNRIFNTLKVHFPLSYDKIERFAAPDSEDFTKVKIVAKVEKAPENRSRTLSTVSSFSELNRSTLSTFGTSPNLSSTPVSAPSSPAPVPAPPSISPPPPPPTSPPVAAPRPPPPAPSSPAVSAPPPMSGGAPPPPPPPPPPPMKQ